MMASPVYSVSIAQYPDGIYPVAKESKLEINNTTYLIQSIETDRTLEIDSLHLVK